MKGLRLIAGTLCLWASLHPATVRAQPAPAPLTDSTSAPVDLLPMVPPTHGGLTASQVAREAVRHSPRARAAQATQDHADRRADRAYSLWAPRLDLSARYTRLSRVDIPPEIRGIFPILLDSYQMRAGLRVPVSDYFLTIADHYRSAHELQRFAHHQSEGEAQAVAYDARREYYELARAIAAHELAEHRIAPLEQFVAEIAALVQAGELGTADLAQTRARLSAAKAEAIRARAARHSAEQLVRRRIGLGDDAPVGIAEPLTQQRPTPPTEQDLGRLFQQASERRPEAQALRELIRARESLASAAGKQRYPSLSLFGEVNLDNPNQRYIPQSADFRATWAVGVELAWSPSDLALRTQQADDSRLDVSRAQQDLRALEDRIAVEVSQAYESAVSAAAAIDTSLEQIRAAEETVSARMSLFHAGEAASREVLDAELELTIAKLRWIDDVLMTHLANAALDHATGQLNY